MRMCTCLYVHAYLGEPTLRVLSALLGLPLALFRELAASTEVEPSPMGTSASPRRLSGTALARMVGASRRQLTLLCHALCSSASPFAHIAAAPLVSAAPQRSHR